MQYHGAADNYTLNGATAVATLYSSATTATTNPAVTLRSVGLERRPGGRVHVRPRALGRLHAPGQPGLGRARSGTACRDPPRRHVLLARWLDTRARSRSRRRTSSSDCSSNLITLDERRPDAAAAVLVPAARREGSGRDERRRPLARPGARRHRVRSSTASRRSARPAATSPTGSASARPRTSIPTASLTNAQAAAYIARRVRGRRCTRSSRSCPTAPMTAGAAVRRSSTRSSARSRREVHEHPGARHEPHPLRLLARLGLERQGRARARDPAWTRTTTTTPAPGSAPSPGFMNGGGFPMRFADSTGRRSTSTSRTRT